MSPKYLTWLVSNLKMRGCVCCCDRVGRLEMADNPQRGQSLSGTQVDEVSAAEVGCKVLNSLARYLQSASISQSRATTSQVMHSVCDDEVD